MIPDAGVTVTDSGVAARATRPGTARLMSREQTSRRDERDTATSWAADHDDRPLGVRGLDRRKARRGEVSGAGPHWSRRSQRVAGMGSPGRSVVAGPARSRPAPGVGPKALAGSG